MRLSQSPDQTNPVQSSPVQSNPMNSNHVLGALVVQESGSRTCRTASVKRMHKKTDSNSIVQTMPLVHPTLILACRRPGRFTYGFFIHVKTRMKAQESTHYQTRRTAKLQNCPHLQIQNMLLANCSNLKAALEYKKHPRVRTSYRKLVSWTTLN